MSNRGDAIQLKPAKPVGRQFGYRREIERLTKVAQRMAREKQKPSQRISKEADLADPGYKEHGRETRLAGGGSGIQCPQAGVSKLFTKGKTKY